MSHHLLFQFYKALKMLSFYTTRSCIDSWINVRTFSPKYPNEYVYIIVYIWISTGGLGSPDAGLFVELFVFVFNIDS